MQAILEALDQTGGKVDDPAAFQEALGALKPAFPRGSVTLDENRNSVQPNYVVQIVKDGSELGFKVVQTIADVDQTFGGLFGPDSPDPSRDEPAKATGSPPPWAQRLTG